MRYAGFWKRFWASVLDAIVLTILLLPSTVIVRFSDGASPFVFVNFFLPWLYEVFFVSGGWQATPGKKLIGIRVTDLAGGRIGFFRATGRYFGKIVSTIIFLIGYIMAGVTERKQALHDIMAGTLVIVDPLKGRADIPSSTPTETVRTDQYVDDDRWVLAGFDSSGHVVRFSISSRRLKEAATGLVIGRGGDCDLQINDDTVSRRHARIFMDLGSLYILDLGSANGTIVDGKLLRVDQAMDLPNMAELVFGGVELTISKY